MTYIILVIFLIYAIIIYNYHINLLNKYLHSKAIIDVYLQQRFDLIPNLVSIVKGYTQYEEEILQNLIFLREEYYKSKNLKIAEKLEEKCEKVMLRVEKYPELKTNIVFLELCSNLIKTENQIQAARRAYNHDTMKYNLLIKTFPNNILAKILKWKEKEMFDADRDAEHAIKVDIK